MCGRASGKTAVLLGARALHLALTVDCSPMSIADPYGLIALVGPSLNAALHMLGFVKGYLRAAPLVAKVLQAEVKKTQVIITRPTDGRQVSIEPRAASGGGDAVRGPSLLGVLMDEAAFFYGEGYEVNDKEIYQAAMPRLLPGAQIVIASSPWGQAGLLWELYRDNFASPVGAAVVKAPSMLMHPAPEVKAAYEDMLRTDPDNAAREFGAQFMSADAERFFPEPAILRCVDDKVIVPGEVEHGERVYFGADFGFAVDSSALMGFAERGEKLIAVAMKEKKPQAGLPLVPSEVVAEFAAEVVRCGAKSVTADNHNRQAIEEYLSKYRLALLISNTDPAVDYVVTRSLMSQGRVSLPNDPRLLAQLRRIKATVKPGGKISIHLPRLKDGGHCDMVSALVCALAGCPMDAKKPIIPKDPIVAMRDREKAAQMERLRANEERTRKESKRMLQSMGTGLKRAPWYKKLIGA